MAEPEVFRLEVDAEPESLAVARLFVAAVLRLSGADERAVDDAKLAISELGASTIVASGEGRLVVSIERTDEAILVSLEPFAKGEDERPDPVDVAMALFPAAAVDPAARIARFSIELAGND